MGVVSAGTAAAPQGVPQVWFGGRFSPGYVVGWETEKCKCKLQQKQEVNVALRLARSPLPPRPTTFTP